MGKSQKPWYEQWNLDEQTREWCRKLEEEADEALKGVRAELRAKKPARETEKILSLLKTNIEDMESYDKNWEDFISGHYLWRDWRNQIIRFGERQRVSDVKFYFLRFKRILYYTKELLYNSRNKKDDKKREKIREKVNNFALGLINISREEFSKKYHWTVNEKLDNYIINPDGTFALWEDSGSASSPNPRVSGTRRMIQDSQGPQNPTAPAPGPVIEEVPSPPVIIPTPSSPSNLPTPPTSPVPLVNNQSTEPPKSTNQPKGEGNNSPTNNRPTTPLDPTLEELKKEIITELKQWLKELIKADKKLANHPQFAKINWESEINQVDSIAGLLTKKAQIQQQIQAMQNTSASQPTSDQAKPAGLIIYGLGGMGIISLVGLMVVIIKRKKKKALAARLAINASRL